MPLEAQPRRRKGHGRRAVEEGSLKVLLQLGDVVAQRLLGNVQAARSMGEIQLLRRD